MLPLVVVRCFFSCGHFKLALFNSRVLQFVFWIILLIFLSNMFVTRNMEYKLNEQTKLDKTSNKLSLRAALCVLQLKLFATLKAPSKLDRVKFR